MDLLSLVLTLRPVVNLDPSAVLPTWWGRAAHALLLNVVQQADPALAQSLHPVEGNAGPRPFTVSTLIGRFPDGQLDTERPYTIRFTALNNPLAELLWQISQDGPLSVGATVELDRLPFQVEAVQPKNDANAEQKASPWAADGVYQEFGAAYLLARQPPPRRITLQFTSPTTFKSAGRHIPIPLPDLVFGSLLNRWNAFAPITFPPETRRYASECLAVSRYRLSSRVVATKGRGRRIGGMGQVTYTSLNYDRYWMSLMMVLAQFALHAGVGAGTAMGLGQCRLVEAGPPTVPSDQYPSQHPLTQTKPTQQR